MTKKTTEKLTYDDSVEAAIGLSKVDLQSSWGELLRRGSSPAAKRRSKRLGYKDEPRNEKTAPLSPSFPK